MKYLIERLGDMSGKTWHNTLEAALVRLRKEYPAKVTIREDIARIIAGIDAYEKADGIIAHLKKSGVDISEILGDTPNTPDPEDDRILIWEIQSNGEMKVVWHFSGWHWNVDEFGLPQGKLIGDDKSLYQLASEG